MPLFLRECIGFDPKKFDANTYNKIATGKDIQTKEFLEDHQVSMDQGVFYATIEAMHTSPDYATRNFTRYSERALKNSLDSWTNPYNIPVIMYHNDYDGQMVGRITKAEMAESTILPGSKALLLTASIPNWESSDNVENGLLSTVSIGMDATDVRCSICGKDVSDEDCHHIRGREYDGQICYWDIYECTARELSFVIVPSDMYAKVIKFSRENFKSDNSSVASNGSGQHVYMLSSSKESKDSINENHKHIDKSHHLTEGVDTVEIKEAEAKISSLETANKALNGDKVALQESVDALNNDKIQLQESIKTLKEKAEEDKLAIAHEKELREAAEGKIEDLQKEVKNSLAESLEALRDKAGKPKIEKLAERSIDSLKDSIADLKAELAESAKKAEEEAKKLTESKGKVESQALKEDGSSLKNEANEAADSEIDASEFDL